MTDDHIKKTPTAQPESEDEKIFFCDECKKHFTESEMSDIQGMNNECPECGFTMSLHSGP